MKFANLNLHQHLREGWFDVNLWTHLIDHLFARSMEVTIVRKEIGLIPRDSYRYDGIFRCVYGTHIFDVGVIEVSPPGMYLLSKHTKDRAKIISGLSLLLSTLTQDSKRLSSIQVIGILCSGWNITLFRMWIGPNGKFVLKENTFYVVYEGIAFSNLVLIVTHIVRYVQLVFSTASLVASTFSSIPD